MNTEGKVTQLGKDMREISEQLDRVDEGVLVVRVMGRRQGIRLDSFELSVTQLELQMRELSTEVSKMNVKLDRLAMMLGGPDWDKGL